VLTRIREALSPDPVLTQHERDYRLLARSMPDWRRRKEKLESLRF